MRYFFTILIATILLSGCATRNAFSKLNIDKEQEIAVENTINGKLMSKGQFGGIFSAIYLNDIYKEIDKNETTFYVTLYIKNKTNDLNITLDKKQPIKIKKLATENRYNHLINIKNGWKTNYLVSFENNESAKMNLQIDSGQFSSGLLNYSKD